MTRADPVPEEKVVKKKFVAPALRIEADLAGLTLGGNNVSICPDINLCAD